MFETVAGTDQLPPPFVEMKAEIPEVSIGTITVPLGCTSGCPPTPAAWVAVVFAAPQVRPPSLEVLIKIPSPVSGLSHST